MTRIERTRKSYGVTGCPTRRVTCFVAIVCSCFAIVQAALSGAVAVDEPEVVRADLPSDATLLADVDGVRIAGGDQLAFTAYAPTEDVWIHVWERKRGSDDLERGVEAIVQGTGMLFGSDVSRRVFTRSDGAPAGYTYRTMMGEGQWVGAVGLKDSLYRIMISGDGSEAGMRRVGERVINTLRLEPVAATATAEPAAFRGQAFTPAAGGWRLEVPTDMRSIPPPFPGVTAALQGNPNVSFTHLFVFDQTDALRSMGQSPAALLRDPETAVYIMQMAAWGDIQQTRQAAPGTRVRVHPGRITRTASTLQYAFSVDMPAFNIRQRFYLVMSENRFLGFCFAAERAPLKADLSDQIIATFRPLDHRE